MKGLATLFYLISSWFMGFGFYKLFVYENPESILGTSKNAYVGGDAYNYIINACQSTGYFVLSLVFVVLGCTVLIINSNKIKQLSNINQIESDVNKIKS